jgi:hypothetical protein
MPNERPVQIEVKLQNLKALLNEKLKNHSNVDHVF